MAKKNALKTPPGGKKKVSPVRKKVAKTVTGSGTRKKSAKKQTRKSQGNNSGTTRTKKVKAEKKMTSKVESEKNAAADGTGKNDVHPPKDKKKSKVKFKSVMLREEAISCFEAIVAGLKRGSIRIRQGDDALVLKPTPQLDVAVKAAAKGQDESITFEIRWRTASDSDLTISTD